MHRFVFSVAVATGVVACKFPPPPDVEWDAGPDASEPDAPIGPAELAVTQGPHDFGAVVVGDRSALLQVTVRNAGGEATGPIAVALGGASPAEFRVVPTGDSSDCAGKTLAGGATCVAQVRFEPTADGAPTARLDLSAEPGGAVSVALSGQATTGAMLTTTQGAYDFGTVVTEQQSSLLTVLVRNAGEQTTGALTVTMGGAHAGDFQIVPTGMTNDCAGATLAVQQTCVAQVRFRPTLTALRSGELTVSASPGGSVTVPLTGNGVGPGNLRVDLPASGMLDFGTRELGTGASTTPTTIRVSNTGGAPTGTLDVAIGGGAGSYAIASQTCDGIALGVGATCDVAVRFIPMAVGDIPATITIIDTAATTGASVPAAGTGSAQLAVVKTGTGTIASTPAGVSCGTACSSQTGTFTQSPVTLTATEDPGWVFSGWTGACASANPSPVCSVSLPQSPTNVGATFTQVFTLNVTATGMGTVTTTTPGILCGNGNTDCTETYPINTAVTLNAEPEPGWEVHAWSGTGITCGSGVRSCMVMMSQARNVTVEFRRLYTLTVQRGGTGGAYGTVSGPGLGCGAACTSTVTEGTILTLAASAPANQATFVSWSGPGISCPGTGSCAVTVNATTTEVTANFDLVFHNVAVTKTGDGAGLGTVTSTPGGISCGSDCSEPFGYAQTVSLSATAMAGATFAGWSGACSGAGPCMFTIDGTKAVSANFTLVQHTVSIQRSGFGMGTVTGTGFDCGSDCTETMSHGSMVTLTATPSAGDVFYGWSGGGCAGTGTCTVTVTAATTVTATFDQCVRSTEECDNLANYYESCSSAGQAMVAMTCPLHCSTAPGVEKCVDLAPTNGLASYLDMSADGPDVTVNAPSTINTTTGAFCLGTECDCIGGPPGACTQIPRTTFMGMRIYWFHSLTVAATLKVTGTMPLVLISDRDVTVTGVIDVSADGATDGPGALPLGGSCDGQSPGSTTSVSAGGGGGGRYGSGGSGGSSSQSMGGVGGQPIGGIFPDVDMIPLQGGCRGGSTGETNAGFGYVSSGGGGGGALQIVSRTRISLTGSAIIDASGGGGRSGAPPSGTIGGGGGGSGGGILLEAPQVIVNGANVVISTKGGGGAALGRGMSANHGSDGSTDAAAAAGGTNGTFAGGAGGATAVSASGDPGSPNTSGDACGGGGAVGVVRFLTASGSINPTGAIRSYSSTGTISTRLVP
ncbi:MAG TPA: choice-of-anchor D domain-containing protein [Kofleriaceae bacterium]|nr:choice-of-anchor D domain-containing protein [Kofleriaceae bacterium]